MMNLDETDRRIVRALQRDGTLSQADLAGIAGASAASCWRRVKALEKAGVLREVVRLVDAEAVGLSVNVLCHIRLKNHFPATTREFEDYLGTREEIVECFAMSGEWDYLIRVVASDIASYERFLRSSLLANPAVGTASSAFALSIRKYSTAVPV